MTERPRVGDIVKWAGKSGVITQVTDDAMLVDPGPWPVVGGPEPTGLFWITFRIANEVLQ